MSSRHNHRRVRENRFWFLRMTHYNRHQFKARMGESDRCVLRISLPRFSRVLSFYPGAAEVVRAHLHLLKAPPYAPRRLRLRA